MSINFTEMMISDCDQYYNHPSNRLWFFINADVGKKYGIFNIGQAAGNHSAHTSSFLKGILRYFTYKIKNDELDRSDRYDGPRHVKVNLAISEYVNEEYVTELLKQAQK